MRTVSIQRSHDEPPVGHDGAKAPVSRAHQAHDASTLRPEEAGADVARLGVLAGGVATAILAFCHALNAAAFGGDLSALDANEEANVFTWASSAAVFAGALAAALFAVLLPARRARFTAVALLLAFFSADDVAQLHERLNRFGQSWTVWVIPLLLVALVLLWRTAAELPDRVRRLVYVGIALLGLAVAMEALQRLWLDEEGTWLWYLHTGVEEAAELLGWSLVATAFVSALVTTLLSARTEPPPRPSATPPESELPSKV